MAVGAELSGRINISLFYDSEMITDLAIESSRPKGITKLFVGQKPQDAVDRIPLIYSLCSVAQTIAGLSAIESELGSKASEEAIIARKVLLLAETGRELAIRVQRDWLKGAGGVELAQLMQWFAELKTELQWALVIAPDGQARSIDLQHVAQRLETILAPLFPENEMRFKEALFSGCTASPLVRVVVSLNELFTGIKLGNFEANTDVTSQYLLHKLDSEGDRFCAQPVSEKGCLESSVWTRNRSRQVIQEAELLAMHPVAQRFLALVLELQEIPQRIARFGKEQLGKDELGKEALVFSDQPGLSHVDAARGRLTHRVKITEQHGEARISEYQVIAPTEWNFHPEGALKQMLKGVKVSLEQARELTERLVLAIDPCVAYKVEVVEHA